MLIDSGACLTQSAGDSGDGNYIIGPDGTAYQPQDYSAPEMSTVHVTKSPALNISLVRVSIPLEYFTSTGCFFQSSYQAHYSNAPPYQQFIMPQHIYTEVNSS